MACGVYGSSELFALTALWPEEAPPPLRWQGGGQPVSPAIEVRSVDPETGDLVVTGATGELQFRGPNVVDTYLGTPTLRQQNLTPDGWFRSGDLGIVDGSGAFRYVCRAGDALRLKGFLVEPAEIEARIATHPAVDMNKVVGLKLGDGTTEAVAFVVTQVGAQTTPEEIRTWCGQTLARHKVPRSIHIVETLPVTSGVNGTKIKAAELREWARELEAAGQSNTLTKEKEQR